MRLNKVCGDSPAGLCETAIAVGIIPPIAPT